MNHVNTFAVEMGFNSQRELELFIEKHKPAVMPEHSKTAAQVAKAVAQQIDENKKVGHRLTWEIIDALKALKTLAHGNAVNAGWYHDVNTGEWKNLNVGERFMLMVTELAEGFEGFRKDRPDDHLPHRSNMEVELADLVIRCMDFAGAEDLDIAGAIFEKMEYNRNRPDHKPENRAKEGGKKC